MDAFRGMFARAWNSTPIARVRTASEVYGIISLGATGIAAVISVLIPALLDIDLSFLEKMVLGIGVFFVALAVILALAKPALKQRASIKDQLEDLSLELRLAKAEKESVEDRLQEVERERDELRTRDLEKDALEERLKELVAENTRLNAESRMQRDRLYHYDGDRLRFRELLQEAWNEGMELRGSKPSESDVREWAKRVYDFINDACGRTPADIFYEDEGDRISADLDATREQAWMDNRLNRLRKLISQVESRDAIPFRSGFDPHNYEWIKRW